MTIRAKILAGCLALTALAGLLGLHAQWAERELGGLALQIYDRSFMGMSYLRGAQVEFASLAASARAGAYDPSSVESITDDLAVAQERAMSPDGAAEAARVAAAVMEARDDPSRANFDAVQASFERAVEVFAGDGFRYRRAVGDVVGRELRNSLLAIGATVVAALTITVVLGRMIVPPIRRAVQVAQAIADGKLDNAMSVAGRGETADLLRALSVMQGSIAGALARIRALMDEQALTHASVLAAQHARMTAALENMNQGLCLFGRDGRLEVANRRFATMFGTPEPGTPATAVMELSGLALLTDSMQVDAVAELSCVLPDGRSIAVSQRPVEGGGWVATFEDVTERQAAEAQLAHMARHDVLTGLPNRLMLGEQTPRAMAGGSEGLALIYLGLDRFKGVNESLGHAAGDALLRDVADRLRGCAGDNETVFRLGGDEFALLQQGASQPQDVTVLARRVMEAMAPPFDLDGQPTVVGASIGVALAADGAAIGEAMLKCADLAMARAKADGRGMVRFFAAEMDAAMQRRRSLELDLRQALAEGQLELFYQPLVKARGIAGFEALMRWRHPERGLISPAVFIPIAEETGLIVPMGAWAMRQACLDAASWPGTLKVAVNLSPAQFRGDILAEEAADALARSGLPASRLELEITESALMSDDAAVSSTLDSLRALGIRIAMDDFGTGFSSLSYLLRFQFDKIKIDQSFVRGITEKGDCLAIVRAVIGLGKALGIAVNAEGVETQQQLDALWAEDCGEVQGYLFSKPRPGSEVADMLRWHGNATLDAAVFAA